MKISKDSISKKIEKTLWILEEQYMENYKNKAMEELVKFWHPEFTGWPDWAEEPVNIDTALAKLSTITEYKILSFKIRSQNILLKDNLAIVYYFIDLKLETKLKKKLSATSRIIHTWIKENGDWQILGGMSAK